MRCLRLLAAGLAGVLVVAGAGPGFEQGWSAKPIIIVVPFPPGPLDVVAHWITPKLDAALGQPAVIDYRPSANGTVVDEMPLMHEWMTCR
jgi:tripartite-type tricarboxylate transporter receptor subunit TctC